MRSDIAPDQSATAALAPPFETAPPPATKSSKKKSTDQRSVLDQKIIDEYWNRRATSDIEWAKSLAGGKLNKTVASQAVFQASATLDGQPEEKCDTTTSVVECASADSTCSTAVNISTAPTAGDMNIAHCLDTTEDIVDNLISSTMQNLESLIHESISRCILSGQYAFSSKNLSDIEASSKELTGLLILQRRFDHSKQMLQEPNCQLSDPDLSDIPEIPGLNDMVKYIGLRSLSNDKVIVEATHKHDYELVAALARCGAKLNKLHKVLLWIAPNAENLDFSP